MADDRKAELDELAAGWKDANATDALPVKVVSLPESKSAEPVKPVEGAPQADIAKGSAAEPVAEANGTDGSTAGAAPEPAKPDEPVDWKAKYEQREQGIKSWEGRLKAAAQREKALQAEIDALKAPKAEPSAPVVQTTPAEAQTPDDGDIQHLMEEYPELAKPLLKRIHAIEERIATVGKEAIAPLGKQLEQLEVERHFARIEAVHPDWRDIAKGEAIQEWAQTKPAYQRAAIEHVLKSGTSDEVNELLTEFKASKPASHTEAPSAAAVAAEAKRKQQLSAAGAVRGRSGGPPPSKPDPNDLEAAWKEALSA